MANLKINSGIEISKASISALRDFKKLIKKHDLKIVNYKNDVCLENKENGVDITIDSFLFSPLSERLIA